MYIFFSLNIILNIIECEPCKSSGHICDPETGECVCPPNTEGEYCQRCTSSSWGYDPYLGCKVLHILSLLLILFPTSENV